MKRFLFALGRPRAARALGPALLVAGMAMSAQAIAVESSNPKSGDPAAIELGLKTYAKFCQQCHGSKADGHSKAFTRYSKDLRKFPFGYGEFVAIVMNGRPKKGMPPWAEYLDFDTINSLGAYLETLATEEAYWK